MEAQMWKPLRIEYRRPQLQDWINVATLGTAVHLQPQVPTGFAFTAAVALLRCLRYRRTV
ncbi:hypothetical protein [Streptomyces tunisiensis]|uniref:hypothetical protein n=1 Tax=Streptomyces tunisiensis TaxID=948699 RepID=UPI003989B6EE